MQLVINKFGSTVYVHEGKFEVSNKEGKTFFSADKVSSILMMKGTKLTTDAIALAIEKEIEIVFIDRNGDPFGRVWSNKYGSVSTIRKNQVYFCKSKDATDWIKQIVIHKIEAQISLLISLKRDRPGKEAKIDSCIDEMKSFAEKIRIMEGNIINDIHSSLRGFEGNASKNYFSALSLLVPEEYEFERRSRRPAKDIFNCTLNYIYGILYARVEGALIKAGIDPYLGVFHRDEYNRPVLAYDFIEKYRVWADAVLMQLCFSRLLEKEMYEIEDKGYWLIAPGKKLVIETFNDYMDEIIQYNHKRRSRLTHIQEDSQEFAQYLLSWVAQDTSIKTQD